MPDVNDLAPRSGAVMSDDLTTRRVEAAARARFNHAAKTDGAWELLSPPQRAFHLAGMRAALAAMEAVR